MSSGRGWGPDGAPPPPQRGERGMGPTVVGAALGWAAGGRVGCFDKAGSPAPSDLGWKELESWALFSMGAVAAPSDGCSLQQAVWEGGFGTRAAARRTTGSSPPVIGSFQSLSKGRPLTSQSRRVAPSNDRDEPSDLPCLDAAMQLWLAGGKFLDKLKESSGNHGLQESQYSRPILPV
ncbi:hypothetical protein ACCO45_008053 [Purpureocillium lilacinum]|uniref:Uncharacterized protein n=1 Tax=Purpureocillium lilacinum TaxID=33203 RepID=A0ACC4DM78_PURLI